ncbi:LacI family DNA-binding transcriptional regulator [Hamadaea tsunoensis]|uniref:LacI family DNA-binding transcriptional regulator n=1 Tax=Hamadaea tsunoensis TaxID=53368 RepID=UPI000419B775|nr:LacI family DNA-binding transcriptional regulator [Hamadaea tsunoensis]
MSTTDSRRPPTIADVAAAAGVSVPTVSRVLTGSVPVSAKRRALVMQAIDELGFRPNAAARALAKGRPSMIAVLAANTSRYGYMMTLEGIEQAARTAGYLTMITVIESTDPMAAKAAVGIALSQPVAGVIVLCFDEHGQAALEALPADLPATAAGNALSRRSGIPRLEIAERQAAEVAVTYLLGLGHKTVHHVALPSGSTAWGRTSGWLAALHAANAPVPSHAVATWHHLSGYEIGRSLAADPDVTAVFCGNDMVAIGVLRAMHEAQRKVPQDVSVIGFDDEPLAAMWLPALTSVRQDFAELGREAFRLLEACMDEAETLTARPLTASLVVRDTTGPAPTRRS